MEDSQHNTKGGKRPGAGRKPLKALEKKIGVTVYVRRKHIANHGGLAAFKKKCVELSEQEI